VFYSVKGLRPFGDGFHAPENKLDVLYEELNMLKLFQYLLIESVSFLSANFYLHTRLKTVSYTLRIAPFLPMKKEYTKMFFQLYVNSVY